VLVTRPIFRSVGLQCQLDPTGLDRMSDTIRIMKQPVGPRSTSPVWLDRWRSLLQTAHCSLNKYLYQLRHAETPRCECGNSTETVTRYLLWCIRYDGKRKKLRKEVGIGGMKVKKLFGYPKFIKPVLEYIRVTKHFTF